MEWNSMRRVQSFVENGLLHAEPQLKRDFTFDSQSVTRFFDGVKRLVKIKDGWGKADPLEIHC